MSHRSPGPRTCRRLPTPLSVGLSLLGLLLGGLCGRLPAQAPPTGAAAPAAPPAGSREDLEKQKLAQEILQLKIANGGHVLLWDRWASFLPFVTALIALAGLGFTYSKARGDRLEAQEQDRKERKKEREQRKQAQKDDQAQRDKEHEQREQEGRQRAEESRRWLAGQQAERQQQLDENFAAALANLRGADDEGKAAAVVSLLSFLKPAPEYAGFHDQVFLILQAMLKLICPTPGHDPYRDEVKTLFVRAFERTLTALAAAAPLPEDMDLARTYLYRVNLAGLSLRGVDVGFSRMESANLSGADLFRVRGYGVHWDNADLSGANLGEARLKSASCHRANFRGARLVAANLKGADLTNADFSGACLQSAHLEGARLNGALFKDADVSDAYFKEAIFGDSLARLAPAWGRLEDNQGIDGRHFSAGVLPLVEAYAGTNAGGKGPEEGSQPEAQKPA